MPAGVGPQVTATPSSTGYWSTSSPVDGDNLPEGSYTLAFASGVTTAQVASVPLPTTPQAQALYLISIDNPSALGVSVTVALENQIAFGGTAGTKFCTLTSFDVASGSDKCILVQGWPLGDGAGQITVTPDATTTGAATVTVRVHQV